MQPHFYHEDEFSIILWNISFVPIYRATLCHNLEDDSTALHSHENLKYRVKIVVITNWMIYGQHELQFPTPIWVGASPPRHARTGPEAFSKTHASIWDDRQSLQTK